MADKMLKIKDHLYYDERSAGGIVFKQENGQVLWLVIKTLSNSHFTRNQGKLRQAPKRLLIKFPKGHLQTDEFLKQAALREVEEEARVKAEIVSKVGSNNYIIYDKLQHHKIIKKVTFFTMRYVGESDSNYKDEEQVVGREWLPYQAACDRLTYDSEKVLLRKAKARLRI